MYQVCIYDKSTDLHPVDVNGFVDLQTAFLNGSVPANMSATPGATDDIKSASGLLSRPKDVFDVMHQASAVKQYLAEHGEADKALSINTENV